MLLDELFITEQEGDAAIIFGRFNPPHQGHVAAWKEAAKFPIWYVGTNQSTIGPKDPLPFDVKIKAMQTLYPELKGHLVAEQSWFTLAAMVYKKHGAVTLHIVTDEADSATYVKMLKGSNGKEGKHGFYDFADIVWQPAPRLSSATDLRAAVAANDPKAFSKAAGVPSDTMIDGEKFFDLVKHYLDAQAKPVKEGSLEAQAEDPIVVISDNSGKIVDKMNLSVAAKKYSLGNPGTIKQQLTNQDFTKIGQYTVSAPMAGQPVAEKIGPMGLNARDRGEKHREPAWSFQEIAEKLKIPVSSLKLLAFKYTDNFPEPISGVSSRHGSSKYYTRSEVKRWVRENNILEKIKTKIYVDEKPSGVTERIVKVGSKFRLVSKKSGKNLGTYDTKEEAKKREREVQYFKHMNEEGGVGVVANNAKQAKDPRYVMSMTGDVKPGETQRQARKMGFKLSKKGIPPSLR